MSTTLDTTEAVKIGSESRTTFRGERWILDGERTNASKGLLCHACKKPNLGEFVYPNKQKSDPTARTLWTCHACTKRLYGDFTQLSESEWGDDEVQF